MSGKRVVSRNYRKKKNSAGWTITGVVFSAILIIVAAWFSYALIDLGMLPTKYIAAILIILAVIVIALTVMHFVRSTRIPSKVLTLLMVVILGLGLFVMNTANGFLKKTSSVSVSVSTVQLYVLNEDPAQTLSDISGYQIGILKTLDRETVDEALSAMENELGSSVSTVEYTSMPELAQALLDGQVGAVLVNNGYFSLLEEEETLSGFENLIRSIWSYEKTRELEISAGETVTESGEVIQQSGSTDDVKAPFIVYISGNDTTGNLKSTGRSDVNILMAVNPNTKKILLVNTPRDYYVELAGIGEKDKLTHASLYGLDTSMNTLGNLYDVSVQYYARMNFTGFQEIIDALGGVTIYSDYAFTTYDGAASFVQGENSVNGTQALAFARERHAFADGDNQRGKNQMAVIKAVINKVASPAILTSYLDVLNAASGSFETNMTQDQIAALVQMQLADSGEWSVESVAVDGTDSRGPVYSAPNSNLYRMIPNDDTVAAVSEQLKQFLEE